MRRAVDDGSRECPAHTHHVMVAISMLPSMRPGPTDGQDGNAAVGCSLRLWLLVVGAVPKRVPTAREKPVSDGLIIGKRQR
jgi:hypothetical protein